MRKMRLNSSLGMQFRTCEKFWESTDFKSSFIPKFFTNTKATPQILEFVCLQDNTESKKLRHCEAILANRQSNPHFIY